MDSEQQTTLWAEATIALIPSFARERTIKSLNAPSRNEWYAANAALLPTLTLAPPDLEEIALHAPSAVSAQDLLDLETTLRNIEVRLNTVPLRFGAEPASFRLLSYTAEVYHGAPEAIGPVTCSDVVFFDDAFVLKDEHSISEIGCAGGIMLIDEQDDITTMIMPRYTLHEQPQFDENVHRIVHTGKALRDEYRAYYASLATLHVSLDRLIKRDVFRIQQIASRTKGKEFALLRASRAVNS